MGEMYLELTVTNIKNMEQRQKISFFIEKGLLFFGSFFMMYFADILNGLYMITGRMNLHPRAAIQFNASEDRGDIVKFFDNMIEEE